MSKLEPTVAELIAEMSRAKTAATHDLDPGSEHPSAQPMSEGGQQPATTGSHYTQMTDDTIDNQPDASPLVEKSKEVGPTSDAEMANQDGRVTGDAPEIEKAPTSDKPTDIEPGTEHDASIDKLASASLDELFQMAKDAISELESGDLNYTPQTDSQQVKAAAEAGYKLAGNEHEERLQKEAAANICLDLRNQGAADADRLANYLANFHQYAAKSAEQLPPEAELDPTAGESDLPPEAMAAAPPEAAMPPAEGEIPPEAAMGGMGGDMPPEAGGEPTEEEAVEALLMALEQSGMTIEDLVQLAENAPPEMGQQVKSAAEECRSYVKANKYKGDRKAVRRSVLKEASRVIDELTGYGQ